MKYNGKFDTSKLFKQLDQTTPAEVHWTFTSPTDMILITLAVFLISILIWKKCFRSQETPSPLLSAPPMTMPIANVPRQSSNLKHTNKVTKSNASILISISIS
jgi:hypothetical protein